MKLQNIIIIFLAIALPVIIILSVYVSYQVDTARLRSRYDDILINSSHEAMLAFQMNTANNQYSNIADKKMRDIQGAFNIFASSLATNVGQTGSSNNYMMAYVPAMAFTLYDGYYISIPTDRLWVPDSEDQDNSTWQEIDQNHEMKSYVYYSKQYSNANKTKILTINFTLDNFISAYYLDVNNNHEYQSRAGYLEAVPENKQAFFDEIDANNDEEVKKYYNEAWEFTDWFNGILDKLALQEVKDKLKIQEGVNQNIALPEASSDFNSEKYDVIKSSLTKNLEQAMYLAGEQMPEFTGHDWDLILNNICFISFMQRIPTGTTVYNNYCITVSTENKETIRGNDLYFVRI